MTSWEADSSDPFQFHTFYRTQSHYHTEKIPLAPVLSQISPVFIPPSPLPNPISSKYALILSSSLCVGFPSGLFSSYFPIKILYALLFPPVCTNCHQPPHPPWLGHHNNVGRVVKIMKFLFISPFSCNFLPLKHEFLQLHLQSPSTCVLPLGKFVTVQCQYRTNWA